MSVSTLEPIIKIFADSTRAAMSDFDNYLFAAEGEGFFSREAMERMFKIVHGIRMDSDMLLYDNITVVSGALEKVLDSYRDQRASTPEFDEMEQVLAGYSAFIHEEADKLESGKQVDGSSEPLLSLINAMDTGEVGFGRSPLRKPGERRRFYIASDTSDNTESLKETKPKKESALPVVKPVISTADKETNAKTPEEVLITLKNKLTSYTISDDEMEELRQIAQDLDDIVSSIVSEDDDNPIGSAFSEINKSLKLWVDRNRLTDFSAIITKCRLIINETAGKLGKNVELVIDTDPHDECRIEKYKSGPLSRALTHLVRNAVSHGIESIEERNMAGKSDTGTVTIAIHHGKGYDGLEISVSDDGCGVDVDALLKRASLRGILTKPVEDYTESEIMQLPFAAGFNNRNDRTAGATGVNAGAEAAAKLIKEIHGRIKMTSTKGKGTKVTVYLPYDHISDLANFL